MKAQTLASSVMYHMSYLDGYLRQKWAKREAPLRHSMTGVRKVSV